MKVISYMRQGFELVPVEVELSLSAGLPQITFLGLPDAMIRESVARIKSALRQQGFEIPAARQVLVHLRPTHLRKSSRGLDLAVAAALLWETGQVPMPEGGPPRVYGELSLKGEVFTPDDLEDLPAELGEPGVMTGPGAALGFPLLQLRELRDLAQPTRIEANFEQELWQRPALPDLRLSRPAAEVISVIAAGEHSTLLAGPPGTGKTTASEVVHSLLAPPKREVFAENKRIHRLTGDIITWRPLVRPHHTVTTHAMVGAGVPPRPGEITRAHGGLLIMDEFLEFDPSVQESLREPLESGEIRLARSFAHRNYPAQFLLIGTTNLCPCGRYLPGRDELCRCSRIRKNHYIQRLRGPFIDRFTMLAYTQDWGDDFDVELGEILQKVGGAVQFAREHRGQAVPNSRLEEDGLKSSLTPFQKTHLLPRGGISRRRYLALLRVARTLADLDAAEAIGNTHLERAFELSVRSFKELERAES